MDIMNDEIDLPMVEVDENANLLLVAHKLRDKEEGKGNIGVSLCMTLT